MIRGAQRDIEAEKDRGDSSNHEHTGREETIIHGILRSGLPAEELRVETLKDHAAALLAGGLASTVWTLSLACFHIINDREVYRKLRLELEGAIDDPTVPVSLEKLEQLPYLMACIDEGTFNFQMNTRISTT